MPRRKAPSRAIAGDRYREGRQNWEPLLALVGEELAGWFMWMVPLRLEDGTIVHAYKHRLTRDYYHLGEDGRAFRYVPPKTIDIMERGSYRPMPRAEVIDDPFCRMPGLGGAPDGLDPMWAELDRVRALAERGEPVSLDPAWLERQRAFEAEQELVEVEREAAEAELERGDQEAEEQAKAEEKEAA